MDRVVFTVHQRGIIFDGKIIKGKNIEIGTKVIFKKEHDSVLSDYLIDVYVPDETNNKLSLLGYVCESYDKFMFDSKPCDWQLYDLLPEEFEGIMNRKQQPRNSHYLFRVEAINTDKIDNNETVKEPEIDTNISEDTLNVLKSFNVDLSLDDILKELLSDLVTLNKILRRIC